MPFQSSSMRIVQASATGPKAAPAPAELPGSTVWRCPQGHELAKRAAEAGTCDGCRGPVKKDDCVMDCRKCNWYLCTTCQKELQPQSQDLWSTISSLIGGSSLLAPREAPAAAPNHMVVGIWQKEKAKQLLADFCETYPACRVAPSTADLDSLFAQCAELHFAPIADAVIEQLGWSTSTEWQGRLRALHVLEYLYHKGGHAQVAARKVQREAKALLEHLQQIPQCRDTASRVILALLNPVAPAPQAEAAAQESAAAAQQAGDIAGPKPSKTKPAPPAAAACEAALLPNLLDLREPEPALEPSPEPLSPPAPEAAPRAVLDESLDFNLVEEPDCNFTKAMVPYGTAAAKGAVGAFQYRPPAAALSMSDFVLPAYVDSLTTLGAKQSAEAPSGVNDLIAMLGMSKDEYL